MIKARWYYAPTLFLMGLLSKLDPLGKNFFPVPTMLFIFFSFILMNVVFHKLVAYIESHNKSQYLNVLAVSQICTELVFFVIILHLSGGAQSVAPIFFFIPIVSSIILFDVVGSLIIAFLSGIFINSIVVLEYYNILENVPGYPGNGILSDDEFFVALASTITTTAIYFIVGALAGYLSSVIKNREEQLSESRRRAQLQAERLRLLNEAYNSYARQLVRKDLDLTKQNERFEQLNRDKSEFVSTVSHQLRTPLSAIKWTLDTLLNSNESGTLTNEQRALLMKAFEYNERIINLIRDMLGIDRIESGALGFSFIEIDVVDLVNNIIDEVDAESKRRNIRFDSESTSSIMLFTKSTTSISMKEKPSAPDSIRSIPNMSRMRLMMRSLYSNAFMRSARCSFVSVPLSLLFKSVSSVHLMAESGVRS
jgi:signal transduction histidine kinase